MKKSVLGMTAVSLAALSAGGCATSAENAPDEFRVVRKAPLSVPPEYNLRPPPVGDSLPVELRVDERAQTILFGERLGANATEGERLLVRKAGAEALNPKIRALVDYEDMNTLRKGRKFSDEVLSFEDGQSADVSPDEADLDKEFIDNATGGDKVLIERKKTNGKLPGL